MTSEEFEGLRKIRRQRGWIWFWVLFYVPAVWIVRRTTHSNVADFPVILIWAVAIVRSISRVMFTKCPRCGGLFHSTHGSPTIWNLFARKCMQCALALKAQKVIYPSLE